MTPLNGSIHQHLINLAQDCAKNIELGQELIAGKYQEYERTLNSIKELESAITRYRSADGSLDITADQATKALIQKAKDAGFHIELKDKYTKIEVEQLFQTLHKDLNDMKTNLENMTRIDHIKNEFQSAFMKMLLKMIQQIHELLLHICKNLSSH